MQLSHSSQSHCVTVDLLSSSAVYAYFSKKLSCRRAAARARFFMSSNISLSHSRSLKAIRPSTSVLRFHYVVGVDWRRHLWSASTPALFIPMMRLSTVGDWAFRAASARTWNSLPTDVTSSPSMSTFKRHLKTVMFAQSCSVSFTCAGQFYLDVTRISFVFLCRVLAIFTPS